MRVAKLGHENCFRCGMLKDDVYLISLCSASGENEFNFHLCPSCRENMINTLIKATPNCNEDRHRGKWYDMWKEDKEATLSAMYKNLSYESTEQVIQEQLAEIDKFKTDFDLELNRLFYMNNSAVNKWCYYDLKKRRVIE